MSFITFQCYSCGKSLKVPADKAGRKAKCNQCGTVLTIPAQSSIPDTPATASQVPAPATAPGFSGPGPYPQPMQTAVPSQEPAFEPAIVDFTAQPTPAFPTPQSPGGYAQPTTPAYPAPAGFPQPAPGASPQLPAGGYDQFPRVADGEYMPTLAGAGGPPKWHSVRLGLLLVFVGACVMAGAYALCFIGYLLVSIGFMSGFFAFGPGNAAFILIAIGTLISLGGTIAAIVGYVFCLLGPNLNNSFGLCIAVLAVAGLESLLIMVAQLPILFSSFGSFYGGQSIFGTWFLFLLLQLLFGAEVILFPLVVRAIALGLNKTQSAKSSLPPIYLAGGYTGARLLTFVFLYIGFSSANFTTLRVMGWFTIIFLWIGIAAFIAFIIVYTLFLWKMRSLIPEK